MEFTLFTISAFAMGFLAAIPSGPVQVEVARRSINGYLTSSIAIIAGAFVADAVYGVIALFGSPHTTTLPLLLYQQLAAYRMPQAAVTAAFLLLFCLLVFWMLENFIGGKLRVKR